jgi:8-oxo-dGTP pyrophosphatase MutT (NUDIX family)
MKSKLAGILPGQDAQYLMAPFHRERLELDSIKTGNYRPSAVMVLFCMNENDELFIPLIERMAYNGVHSAQISLPGGKFEPADENLQQTAVRECFEEIGVNAIDVIGNLTQLHIPVSGFLVQPVVGICTINNPPMISQEREVKTILKLKLETLLNSDTVKQGVIETAQNMRIKTPYFDVENNKVWGATAMILSELKELLKTIS